MTHAHGRPIGDKARAVLGLLAERGTLTARQVANAFAWPIGVARQVLYDQAHAGRVEKRTSSTGNTVTKWRLVGPEHDCGPPLPWPAVRVPVERIGQTGWHEDYRMRGQ
jgi:hypothetical protein